METAEIVLYVGLGILASWSIAWVGLSAKKLSESTDCTYLWYSHAAWALINMLIAGFGAVVVARSVIDSDFVTSQRNIVAINILLDVGYVVAARWLMRKSESKYQQIGRAVQVQGAFLFFFDIVFAIALTLAI